MGRLEPFRLAHRRRDSPRGRDPCCGKGDTLIVRLMGNPRSFRNDNNFRRRMFPILSLGLALLGGCSVGPKYSKPTTQIPPSYKENANWKPAQPSDQAQKGNWWEMFQDPQLNTLEEKLSVSNQTLRAANDRFMEARAALRISRAARFPMVSAGSSINEYRQSLHRALANPNAPVYYSDFLVSGGDVSYEADVW